MNIQEKNETKTMHRIIFMASNSVNVKGFICCYDGSDVSKWPKIIFNPIYSGNEFGDPESTFCI